MCVYICLFTLYVFGLPFLCDTQPSYISYSLWTLLIHLSNSAGNMVPASPQMFLGHEKEPNANSVASPSQQKCAKRKIINVAK